MSDELAASPGRFRTLAGAPAKLLRALLISSTVLGSLWALEVHNYFEITFFKQQYLALFLALSLCAVFLAVKAHPKQSGDHVPWYDWFLALGGMAIGLYVTILYPTIAYRLGISEHTVKFHVESVFRKLDVRTRAEAVAKALDSKHFRMIKL